MLHKKPVFAELFGLVIFDLHNLIAFQKQHALGPDILQALTASNLGEKASEQGVAIPISGIAGEYYHVAITKQSTETAYLTEKQISIRSKGWVLESTSGEIIVCGIGYLKQFNPEFFTVTDKFPRLPIATGWNEIEIVGGIDEDERLVYELLANSISVKPTFSGNYEDSFELIDD